MTRIAFDSNLLLYAELEPDSGKGKRSQQLIVRSASNIVIPAQVLGEFLRVIQRRVPSALAGAVNRLQQYRGVALVPPTTDAILAQAAEIAVVHKLQLWDAVICVAAETAGATVLLTEDLQDGRRMNGLLFLNPFQAKNNAAIEAALI